MRIILTGLIASLVAACGQTSEPHVEETIDDVWHKAKLRGVAFRAIGQEPGWLLEITNGKEIVLVYAVDHSIAWHLATGDLSERWKEIHFMNDFVADFANRNLCRPTNDEWDAQRTFQCGEIGPAPWSTEAVIGRLGIWAVVRGKDEDGVLVNTEPLRRVE